MDGIHKHQWQVELNEVGDGFVVSCSGSGDCEDREGGTLLLVAPSNFLYNGEEKTATIVNNLSDSVTLSNIPTEESIVYLDVTPEEEELEDTEDSDETEDSDDTATVVYVLSVDSTSLPTQVGDYVAEVTWQGQTAQVEFSIVAQVPTYVVTFVYDNGTENLEIGVTQGDTVAEPSKPDQEGYTFLGWFDREEEWDFDDPISKNLTLTAKWEEKIIETLLSQVQPPHQTQRQTQHLTQAPTQVVLAVLRVVLVVVRPVIPLVVRRGAVTLNQKNGDIWMYLRKIASTTLLTKPIMRGIW